MSKIDPIVVQTDQRILVKKNSKRIFYRNGRMMVLPSKGYSASAESIMWDFKESAKGRSFDCDVVIEYVFFTKKVKVDIDNLMASVNDMLQEVGVISDDSNVVAGTFQKVVGGNRWGCVLTIHPIDNDVRICVE